MRGRISLLAALAAGIVGLSGCTGPGAPANQAEQPDPWSTPASTLWSAEAELVGDPVVGEDVVVSYVRADQGVAIAAWDLTTGAELWSAPAVVGGSPPGVQVNASVVVAGGQQFIAYFVPHVREEYRRVVVADMRTGAAVPIEAAEVMASTHIQGCAGKSHVFCFEGVLAGDETVAQYELDPVTGIVAQSAERKLPEHARMIGGWVFATAHRPPAGQEMLGLLHAGQIVWTRPYEEVFGLGFSSDGGWDWSDGHDLDVIVGTGRYVEAYHPADVEPPADPALHRTVGLQRETGATVWSLDDTTGCPFQPGLGVLDGVVVLCTLNKGTAQDPNSESPNGENQTDEAQTDENQIARPAYTDVTMIGVDATTGKTVWSVPVGDAVLGPADSGFHSGYETLVVDVEGTVTLVDAVEGPQRALPENATVACWQNREPLELMFGGELRAFSIGEDHLPCDASGAQQATFSIGAAQLAGEDAPGGLRVIATPGALIAVQIPDD